MTPLYITTPLGLIVRTTDALVNITHLCKEKGTTYSAWKASTSGKEIVREMHRYFAYTWTDKVSSGPYKGVYVHRFIVPFICEWIQGDVQSPAAYTLILREFSRQPMWFDTVIDNTIEEGSSTLDTHDFVHAIVHVPNSDDYPYQVVHCYRAIHKQAFANLPPKYSVFLEYDNLQDLNRFIYSKITQSNGYMFNLP